MNNDVLLIHYAEIGTKGKNRSFFERRLREAVRARLMPNHITSLKMESARLVADLIPGYDKDAVRAHMDQVFGVAWYAFAKTVGREWEALEAAAVDLAKAHPDAKTFKVFCRRTDKTFPASSQDVCMRLGGVVMERAGLKVQMEGHDLPIHIDLLPGGLGLAYGHTYEGLRGMPRGSSGGMLCLFSGGIDSPVAAWALMRRGARVHLLHFHPFRSAEEVIHSKIGGLYERLKIFNPGCRLFLASHARYQVEAALKVPPAFETVIFRRYIFRTAEELCRLRGWKAIITGDSLGQVASQTLENLHAAQGGLSLPVFAPFIAADKEDVIHLAKKIGTFDLSVQDYKDCCSLMSRKPKTNVSVEMAQRLDADLNLTELARQTVPTIQVWDGKELTPLKLPEPK